MNKMDLLKERVILAQSKLNEKMLSEYPYLNEVITPDEKDELLYIFREYDEYKNNEKDYLFSVIESAFEYLPGDEFISFMRLIMFFMDQENSKLTKYLFDKMEINPFFIIDFLCLCFTGNETCAKIDIDAKKTNRLYCVRRSVDKKESDDILFPSDLLEQVYHLNRLFKPEFKKDN